MKSEAKRTDPYATNWSENIPYSSDEVLLPSTIHEVQKIVKDKSYS